ncbi:M48 family metallopeptidase [Shewanella nanhaiensis]|uniref:M48 family metallopeptidase n=1 Tax=Shewanella nanhaiensis TaxID=2864872 RepID=A0ABS7E4I1_9GAMM|nr:M48 family metallopeptidase [Shewanella nanhaiensis]MBW8184597.1 M48 family metallopeptidase [Shewanella nanhaiensis]
MSEVRSEYLYPCHGIHSALPKGRASGQLTICKTHLMFTVNDKRVQLGFAELEISQGGASDRLIFFNHPACADWRFYCSDRSVLKNPYLKQAPHLNSVMTKATRKRQFNWLVLTVVVLLCVLVPVGLLANLGTGSKMIAKQIPVEWEETLGSSSFDQYSLQSELMDEQRGELLLTPLVQPLLEVLPNKRYQYQFYISDDSELNAFALPGGVVVINSGLILAADSPEELLGVLSHEIVHVREQHGIRNLISSAGTYLILSAILGDVSGLMAVVVDSAPLLINQGYSRQFETQADEQGFDILVTANIDPKGLPLFFNKLLDKEAKMLESIEDEDQRGLIETGLGFLSSHPATKDRIENLQTRAENIDAEFIVLDEAFFKLQDEVAEFVVKHEKPESGL